MPTLNEIFGKMNIMLYQNESLDLDHYYQEPYQDEGDEIKEIGEPFEKPDKSKKKRKIDLANEDRTYSGFSYFMDGSRRTYKIGDMVLDGRKICPVVIAQVRAGCTERDDKKKLHTHESIQRKNLLLLSDKMNDVDFMEIRQRIMKTQIAKSLNLDVVKYHFDPAKDNAPVNAAIAKANTMMYSNPMHVYREYIQNSTDSIDKAIAAGVLDASEASVNIQVNESKRTILIHDNGLGIPANIAQAKLMDIGASDKNGINERGFRGIGRLAGLAYAEEVRFITSAVNEDVKTVMICDCIRLQQLLQKSNNETKDLIETFKAITRFETLAENPAKHYFEVQMNGVPDESGLLDETAVFDYLAETAPIDFDAQKFTQARKIREYFDEKGCPITCYKILRGTRKLPIYKKYSRSLSTGKTVKTKSTDHVKDVEFVYKEASDGSPLYIGWLAITDFSGIISDDTVQGIRFRKGNILVGDGRTFSKYFPSEGHNANRMFAGEIHALHKDLLPNSQRDDFEPNEIYNEMRQALSEWAGTINRKYRRGTSVATSALRKLNELNVAQKELEEKINDGAITSDEKREQITDQLNKIAKSREAEEKKVRKALEQGTFDEERRESVKKTLSQTETATQRANTLSTKIVNADYATKKDLPWQRDPW